jgi:phenylalanyl-tRNA synthetase beta chain
VRRAKAGEEIVALDGKTYRLDPDICVIADEAAVESIAGIMGGEASGCSEATTDVLVESALWDPINIAQTGRKLGIHSDARHRFERGVDPAFMLPGLELATRMILDLCGGRPSEIVVAGEVPLQRQVVDLPLTEV